MKKTIIVSFAVIALSFTQSAFAASDYLLKLDGIEGESTKASPATSSSMPVDAPRGEMVACTMDAKQCPDGSYVGRTGPACEFTACPSSSTKATPPATAHPTPPPVGDPDFDLIKVTPTTPSQGGKGEVDGKIDEGTKLHGIEPDEIDVIDEDDDDDGVLTKTEELEESVSVRSVIVRGWDPKKKEEFMSEQKEAAEVRSGEELEHFAQGVLLADEKIVDVQFNPKELSVSYEATGKFLWFIPMSYTERLVASGDEGSEVTFATKKPWWGFLMGTSEEGEDAAAEAAKKHKETIEISSWSFGASNQAMLLSTISNVLKTKHDTAKNSVGSVR